MVGATIIARLPITIRRVPRRAQDLSPDQSRHGILTALMLSNLNRACALWNMIRSAEKNLSSVFARPARLTGAVSAIAAQPKIPAIQFCIRANANNWPIEYFTSE